MCFTDNDTIYGKYFYVEICEMPVFAAAAKRKLEVTKQSITWTPEKEKSKRVSTWEGSWLRNQINFQVTVLHLIPIQAFTWTLFQFDCNTVYATNPALKDTFTLEVLDFKWEQPVDASSQPAFDRKLNGNCKNSVLGN